MIIVTTTDKAASAPIKSIDPNGSFVQIPGFDTNLSKVAEIGLQVDYPVSSISDGAANYVDLNGAICVLNGNTDPKTLRAFISRKNTLIPNDFGQVIYQTEQTINEATLSGPGIVTFNIQFTDGAPFNIQGQSIPNVISAGYYAYSLHIVLTDVMQPDQPLIITGPVSFSGTSYVKNV